MNRFLEKFGHEWMIFDGGFGSQLQARGMGAGELPELWNLTHAEVIREIYEDYVNTGCDVITANTFGANSLKYPTNLREVIFSAVSLAKEVVEKAGRPVFVAYDMGPTGKLLAPMGDLEFEDAVKIYGIQAALAEEAGADLILCETFSDSLELKAAVLGAKENSKLPVLASCIFDENGKMLTGGTVDTVVAMLEGLRVDGIGMNCGLGPKQMISMVMQMVAMAEVPVFIQPNAGLPRMENGHTLYDVSPNEFAEIMKEIALLGVQAVGGCCGTTPEHIFETKKAVALLPFVTPTKKNLSVISGFGTAVYFGKKSILIGERINPTGKSKFKQALRDSNMEYIIGEAFAQEEAGAHVLDVNVGLPEIDEPAMMKRVIQELQGVTPLPLQIDTSDAHALENALRIYNGKPMVNSVNGKQEIMDVVFPLIQKYGGLVVALTLDEDGIPETAEGRVRIAEKIYEEASKYGIGKNNIIVDCLTMAVSADASAGMVTLEAVKRVTEELHGLTVLGVSNVSFGLPQRMNINESFYTMALYNGLSAAILNPNAAGMRRAYYSFEALKGRDNNFETYISLYNEPVKEKTFLSKKLEGAVSGDGKNVEKTESKSLQEAVKKGLRELAASITRTLLEHQEPLEIIDGELIPALDVVGKGFEKGTVFLPQLLMSAEAAKDSFEVIKEKLAKSGGTTKKKGKIILATVKGDIHDIGKNIVKVLLENYNYQVFDLGRDVDPEKIVDLAVKENVKLVGLSALMTTTVVNMETTIKLLQEKKPEVRVMVGGAVLTQEYADMIHADFYSKDAMGSVNYAEKLFEEGLLS